MNETLDELASQIRQREQARIARKTNEQKVVQYEQEQALKSTEALSAQREKVIDANTKLERAKIDAQRMINNTEAELTAELDSAKARLAGSRLRAEAIQTTGKADAAVITAENEAEIAALKTAVEGFGSSEVFAEYHIVSKVAPVLSEIFASDTSDFAKHIANYLHARPPSLVAQPAIGAATDDSVARPEKSSSPVDTDNSTEVILTGGRP